MTGLLQQSADGHVLRGGLAATLYDPDGVSGARAVTVLVSNARALPLTTTRGMRLVARVLSGTEVTAGCVLAVPALPTGWYLVANALASTLAAPDVAGATLSLLALPYQLTTRRADRTAPALQPDALDGWDEPVGSTTGGTVSEPETLTVVRVGLSNQFDPLALAEEGRLPAGVTTLYAPLGVGSALRVGDEVRASSLTDAAGGALVAGTVPLELAYTVTALNHLFAQSVPYGVQALLSASTGSGS